jgi:hypothetical protein
MDNKTGSRRENNPVLASYRRVRSHLRSLPAKRLRNGNVLTLLSVAGLMLSIAALLVLIGIGETQIAASIHGTTNLFANGWLDVGLLLALCGVAVAVVAISANSVQAAARKKFPDLVIKVEALLVYNASARNYGIGAEIYRLLPERLQRAEPPRSWSGFPGDEGGSPPRGEVPLLYLRLRILNREHKRTASLRITFCWAQKPIEGPELPTGRVWLSTIVQRYPIRWEPRMPPRPIAVSHQLRFPLHLEPQTEVEGDVFFELSRDLYREYDERKPQTWIDVFDNVSGTLVQVRNTYPDGA